MTYLAKLTEDYIKDNIEDGMTTDICYDNKNKIKINSNIDLLSCTREYHCYRILNAKK